MAAAGLFCLFLFLKWVGVVGAAETVPERGGGMRLACPPPPDRVRTLPSFIV